MNKKSLFAVSILCVGIMVAFMLSIALRFLSDHYFEKQYGSEHPIVKLAYWDAIQATDESQEEETEVRWTEEYIEDLDWEGWYPFSEEAVEETNKAKKETEKQSLLELSENSEGAKTEDASNQSLLGWYKEKFSELKTKIENYTGDKLMGQSQMVMYQRKYDNLISWNWVYAEEPDAGTILFMENGYFTYSEKPVEDEDMDEIAKSVTSLAEKSKELGIPFYYINAGSKVNPNDKQLSYNDMQFEFTNETGDALLNRLKKNGVNVIDMRQEIINDGLDWYNSFYKTDHHWTTQTSLWAAKKEAQILNEKEGFNYDLSMFDESQYEMTTYEDAMFGGQGRAVTYENADLEPFTTILPKFDTNFNIQIPSKNINNTGAYYDVIFNAENMKNVSNYTREDQLFQPTAYESIYIKNYALTRIFNNMNNNNPGRKILLLQDSFSWFSTSFLACDIDEVVIIDPKTFTGSIQTFVEMEKPDAILAIVCERNVTPIDKSRHNCMMDFR